jgi:hypothetical protein
MTTVYDWRAGRAVPRAASLPAGTLWEAVASWGAQPAGNCQDGIGRALTGFRVRPDIPSLAGASGLAIVQNDHNALLSASGPVLVCFATVKDLATVMRAFLARPIAGLEDR